MRSIDAIISLGGADGDRTRDLIVANDVLSQLSHSPKRLLDYRLMKPESKQLVLFVGRLDDYLVAFVFNGQTRIIDIVESPSDFRNRDVELPKFA